MSASSSRINSEKKEESFRHGRVTILFHYVILKHQNNLIVHPMINNYCVALQKDKYLVRVLAVKDTNYAEVVGKVRVNYFRRIPGLKDGFSLRMIPAMIKDEVDLVIIHGYKHLVTLFGLMIYGIKKRRLIVVNTGLYAVPSQRRLLLIVRDFLIGRLLVHSGAILVNLSTYDRFFLDRYLHLPKERNLFLNIWNSEDRTHNFSRLPCFKDPISSGIVALYVGRLDDGKAVDMLLSACKKVKELGGIFKLVVVGDGPQLGMLRNLAKFNGMEEDSCFAGWVSHGVIWQYYQMCDILVLPTRTEGRARVVIEALANGKPVLASDLPQNREIIRHGFNGLLFRTEDDLAKWLLALCKDSQLLASLTANARESKYEFSAAKNERQFLEIVRNAICKQN